MSAWPRPQKAPSRAAARLARSSPGGDERRHGRDVVGVGRVAEAEQRGDEDHDEDGAAAREAGDRVVEPEHVGIRRARCPVRTGSDDAREAP